MWDDDTPPLYAPHVGDEPPREEIVVSARELLAAPYEPPRFAIAPLIPRVGVVLISGDTGAGKTSLVLHAMLALASGLPIAGRFAPSCDGRPVLYANREMEPETLRRFLAANAAGLGLDASSVPDSLVFHGRGGYTDLLLSSDAQRLVAVVRDLRPCVLVLDTQRALLDIDENDARAVRARFDDLRRLAQEYQLVILIIHHLRKIGAVSNTARERVSGSRDLIAAVDVHLALRSQSGRPVSSMLLDKTRYPVAGISAGAEWPIDAQWIDGEPPRSTFAASEPDREGESSGSLADYEVEILSRLAAEGPLTAARLGAAKGGGNRRRALDALRQSGAVVPCGRDGRAVLHGLPEQRRHRLSLVDGGRDDDD